MPGQVGMDDGGNNGGTQSRGGLCARFSRLSEGQDRLYARRYQGESCIDKRKI